MRFGRAAGAVWLLALGGMGMGHWLTYTLARPHAHERAELLASTGHGFWGPLALTGTMALFAAGGALALVAILRSAAPGSRRIHKHAPSLIGLQCGSFVAVELIERAFASGHGIDLWGGGVLLAGLVVQALTACAALLVGSLLTSVIAATRRLRVAWLTPPLRPVFAIASTSAGPGPSRHFGTPRLRAPPAGTA